MPVVEITDASHWNREHDKSKNKIVVCDFTASWCGPCKMVAPHYLQLSDRYSNEATFLKLDVDAVREVAQQERIASMPSFVFYFNRQRLQIVQGADIRKVEALVKDLSAKHNKSVFSSGGHVLGGPTATATASSSSSSSNTRFFVLGGGSSTKATGNQEEERPPNRRNPWADPNNPLVQKAKVGKTDSQPDSTIKPPAAQQQTQTERKPPNTPWANSDFKPPSSASFATAPSSTAPASGAASATFSSHSATSTTPAATANDASLKVNAELLQQLRDMGFAEVRAEKSLILTQNRSLEVAMDWLLAHQDDADIDQPLSVLGTASTPASSATSAAASSSFTEPPPGLNEDELVLWHELQAKKAKEAAARDKLATAATSSNSASTTTVDSQIAAGQKRVADMTSEEKMQYLEERRKAAKEKRAKEELDRQKTSEKNRQNLTKAVGDMKEKLEQENAKNAYETKKREELEARKAKAGILAKINAEKERRRIEQQRAIEDAKKLKEQQPAATAAQAKK